jgi:thiol:disulfide interchange protein DsbD
MAWRSVHELVVATVLAATAAACLPTYAQTDETADAPATTDRAQSETKIAWRDDAHAAMAQGRKSGKLVLFDVGASWCPNCKKMQETTYTDPAVCSRLNQNFICVALDKDDNGDGARLCDAMLIMALPTVVIVDPQTDKYMMKVGYQDAAKFQAMIDKVEKHGLHGGNSGFRLTPKVYSDH